MRDKAASAVQEGDRELEAAMVALRAEVDREVQAVETARENVTVLSRTEVDLAAQVAESIRMAYEAGGRSFLELIDAQRGYHEVARAQVTNRAEYRRALSRYYAAIGRKVNP